MKTVLVEGIWGVDLQEIPWCVCQIVENFVKTPPAMAHIEFGCFLKTQSRSVSKVRMYKRDVKSQWQVRNMTSFQPHFFSLNVDLIHQHLLTLR